MLGGIVAEQERAFQVVAFRLRAIQLPIEAGAGLVVGGAQGRVRSPAGHPSARPAARRRRCAVVAGCATDAGGFPGRGLLQVGGLQLALRPRAAAVRGSRWDRGAVRWPGRADGRPAAQQAASRKRPGSSSDQRNVQPPRQFHGHQRQRQRLSLAPLQHQRKQGRARLQGKSSSSQKPCSLIRRSNLGALAGRGAVVQARADLPDEFVELAQGGVPGRIRRRCPRRSTGPPRTALAVPGRDNRGRLDAGPWLSSWCAWIAADGPFGARRGRFRAGGPKVVTVRRSFVQYPARRAPPPGRRPCGRFADACLY